MPDDPRFQPKFSGNPVPTGAPRIVEVLAFPSVQLLDVAGPLQVFATANEQARGARPYAPRVIGWGDRAPTSSAGLRLAVDPTPLSTR